MKDRRIIIEFFDFNDKKLLPINVYFTLKNEWHDDRLKYQTYLYIDNMVCAIVTDDYKKNISNAMLELAKYAERNKAQITSNFYVEIVIDNAKPVLLVKCQIQNFINNE